MGAKEGNYSQMVAGFVEAVYPSYREDYQKLFAREEIIRRFQNGEKEVYIELQQKGLDNQYHWISVHVIVVENPYSDDIMAICMTKLLDTQRAEQARQEQLLRDVLASAKAANRAKSDFLSRMSHDIRTPMNAIIGMSAIGQMKLQDTKGVQECFRKIDASSQYLLSIINDILDMAKIEKGKMVISSELFDLSAMLEEVEEIISPQAADKKLDFKIQCHGLSGQHYMGDALRLKQILMNLLSNALKFTPAGGSVLVDIRETKRREEFAIMELDVRDTGIGMSEDFMSRIFQPFEQEDTELARNYVGSGLGLSIVYNLVQLMNGTIEVHSEPEKGSEFRITLPLKTAGSQAGLQEELIKKGTEKDGNQELRFSGKRVLLVEDNELNRVIAKELLEMNGILVETAGDGEVAVRMVTANPPDYYAAVLMDIRMPVMDGMEATRRIRRTDRADLKRLPIIAMTANAFEEDRRIAIECGMNGYLVKPFDMKDVLDELEKFQ